MRRSFPFVLMLVFCLCCSVMGEGGFREIGMEEVEKAFDKAVPAHPRLFMNDKDVERIKGQMESDEYMQTFYKAMLAKADGILDDSPVERVKTGRRLLGVSRECLDRVTHLSAAYRFTGKDAYLKKAEDEMLAAAGFSDWNPSHFLDVAEMTAALAIGYDWLFDDLSEESRTKIKQAIMEKGIQPSFKNKGWVRGGNNWNQVCNGGITLGALAVMEDEPKLARELVHRAVNGVQVVMKHYEPDGAYPEGPGYWVYGTTYNVVLFSALESVLGTDFGLSKAGGFANCASYFLHVIGPTGLYFNYPDSGSRGGFVPAVYWFAKEYNQPSLAWNQDQIWKDALGGGGSELVSSRLAPLLLTWRGSRPEAPTELCWRGRGSNSVAMFRSSWTDGNAVYLAIKGGSPGVSHGHMDVGTFVIDADGVRWVVDLGPESYNKIESLGMNLWGRNQGAERWKIFRYNNLSHSTLAVNGEHQKVDGSAPIIRFSSKNPFPHVVFDMTTVYKDQLAQALRGASVLPSGQVVIQDEFKATDKAATVRWAMVTPAKVSIEDDKNALLTRSGKTMRLNVVTHEKVKLQTYSTAPKADYDASNGDTRSIGFEVSLSPGQAAHTVVVMTPSSSKSQAMIDLPELLKWSKP